MNLFRSLLVLMNTVLISSLGVAADDQTGNTLEKKNLPYTVEKLASGFQFVEGPAWVNSPKAGLLFSDIPANKIFFWDAGSKTTTEWLNPSYKSNGLAVGVDGAVYLCQHEARCLSRITAGGASEILAPTYLDKKFNSPNDLAFYSERFLWFTDPTYGLEGREEEQPVRGVYRLDLITKEVQLMESSFDQPNGLCFSPDGKFLYVADSGKPAHVRRFTLDEKGVLTDGIIFCTVPKGVPDGIKCDNQSNLFVTREKGVTVYGMDGHILLEIVLPETPANLCLIQAETHTLYLTAGTSLYRVKLTSKF